jgi:iron complex outermembrane receptor protein
MNVEVTSVSKSKQRLGDSPAAVTVISQDDINRSGLHDIPDMLRLSPGIFVQRGNQFTGWSVSSRGFGALFSDKLLVLEDGRTLYTPLFSGVYWNTVDYPTPDLDRIEVIRGPGATLWGSNAVNGVINITTKSAADTQGLLLDSRVGSDESDATVQYGGKIDDDTFYRVYGKGSAYNDLDDAPAPGDSNQFQDSTTGFRVDRYSSAKDTLTLQGDTFYQAASDQLVTGHVLTDYSHDYRNGQNILGRWSHVDSSTSDYSLQAYYDRIDFRDGFTTFENNSFDTDWQQRFEFLHNNEVIYGLGARLQKDGVGRSTLPAPIVDPSDRDTYLLSAFIQDTLTIVPDRFRVIAGSKFEDNSFTGFEVQPSARLLWTPSEDTTVWGGVSRAVRTPSRLEWDESTKLITPLSPGNVEEQIKGSDHPESEELVAYEVGDREQISKTFSVDSTAFCNVYRDLIGFETTGTTLDPGQTPSEVVTSAYANDQSARTYGTEVALNLQATDNLRFEGSYSLLIANVTDYSKYGVTPNASAIDQSFPRNMFQVHSYLDVTRNIQLNASVYYYEAIGNKNVLGATGPAPGSYVRGDLGVNWQVNPNLELSAGVQNAFEPHHLEASFNADYSAEADRAVYAEATWRY